MRRLSSPLDSFYFRLPVQDLFFAILKCYVLQKNDDFRKKSFSCFRGCRMHPDQFQILEDNVGGFIQMEGFTSTSWKPEQAAGFFKDTWIEVKVNLDNLGGEMDWGFADIAGMSFLPDECEILFNPINIFKVAKC